MSEKAIRQLKRKFIMISMGTLITTMILIAGFLYFGNTLISRHVIQGTLNYIIENNGDLIQWNQKDAKEEETGYVRILDDIFSAGSGYRSPEFPFNTRYFAVSFDKDRNVREIKTSYITAVTREEAEIYGKKALDEFFQFGRIDDYYYQVKEYEDGSSIVVYLDSSDVLRSNERLLYLALILIGFGMLVAFWLVRVLSSRVIRQEIRNAELQKQFMTNASHELKTPLAVIRANTEMGEMLEGETEWSQSTMRQIDRMNGLIQNLVMITRADEKHGPADTEDVDVSKTIKETVENFRSMAVQSGKQLDTEIAENVRMRVNEAQLRQLCSLLADNAIKYCDEEGTITAALSQKGKGILLTVSNSYAEGENVDYTRFFERFYREDSSHNVDRGGYGIGLSIAESLVRQYRGNIQVTWKKGVISFCCQLKSAKGI